MMVVVALQAEGAKETLNLKGRSSLAVLPGTGLVGGIQPVGGLLKQKSNEARRRLEDGRSQQYLQLLDGGASGGLGAEASNQFGDFRLSRQQTAGSVFF